MAKSGERRRIRRRSCWPARTNFKNYQDVSADPKERNAACWWQHPKRLTRNCRPPIGPITSACSGACLELGGDLGTTPAASLPTRRTNPRPSARARSRNWSLSCVQYTGAILLIAFSREGGEPTLQGLWNRFEHAAVGQQVHLQYQHGDELLAR